MELGEHRCSQFEGLPIEFSMSEKLMEIQQQMLGQHPHSSEFHSRYLSKPPCAPTKSKGSAGWRDCGKCISTEFWPTIWALEKLCRPSPPLPNIKKTNPDHISIVVCPTSLVYNWKEEFTKFNPKLKVLAVDGTPTQRKKLLDGNQKL